MRELRKKRKFSWYTPPIANTKEIVKFCGVHIPA